MTQPDAIDDRSWVAIFLLLPKPMRVTAYVAVGLVGALIVSLLMVVAVARQPLPQTEGELELAGAGLLGDGRARRARHPAALRRQHGRPDARAGLRPRPGAVLRDGRAPPHHVRSAVGAVRRDHRRDRQLRAHPRLARGRRARGGTARARHPQRLRGLRRRRQRLPRPALRLRPRPRVHRAARDRARLRAGAVDDRRLARLAQGDGVGPARQHDRRDRAGARAVGEQPRAGRRALPGVRRAAVRPDRRPGRCRRRRLRPGRERRHQGAPAAGVPLLARRGRRA